VSQEILEKAFNKTKELEQKQLKQMKIAEMTGRVVGSIVAVTLDALVVWAIVNYLIGLSVGFVPVLGGILMSMFILAKIRPSK
jgi:uncharacterized protein YacL